MIVLVNEENFVLVSRYEFDEMIAKELGEVVKNRCDEGRDVSFVRFSC